MITRQEERDRKAEDKAERDRLANEAIQRDQPWYDEKRSVPDPNDGGPVVSPQAAPAQLGSSYTVTVANPTPPTNVVSTACGTPPHYTEAAAVNPRDPTWVPGTAYTAAMKPTFTDDAALMVTAMATVPAVVGTTVIATPVAGSSGPVAEATGTVVVVTQPLAGASQPASAFPQQIISTMGSFTSTPNSSHASSAPHITYLTPNPTLSTAAGGTPATLLLTVSGSGFNSSSVVNIAAVAQTTVFVNSQTLQVAAAARKAAAGNLAINVTTDSVGGPPINWVFT
jgi:hypothetical protein